MSTIILARMIREVRYVKGWGPDDFARRANISRTALYQIERGTTRNPHPGTLKRIACALGVPLDVLLRNTLVSNNGEAALPLQGTPATTLPRELPATAPSRQPEEDLIEKFRVILSSPLAEGMARIVEEAFRLLPIIPSPRLADRPRFAPPVRFEPLRQAQTR
jgi:transcriptional regulator with XRE-family HTH domain